MKHIISVSLFVLLLNLAVQWLNVDASQKISDPDLIAYYPFDGNALDTSGQGNDGSVFGAELTEGRYNVLQQAYQFDGVDDVIGISSIGDWGEELSITAWVHLDDANSGEPNIILGSRTPSQGATLSNFLLFISEEQRLRFFIFGEGFTDADHSDVSSQSAVLTDTWIHVAGTYSQNTGLINVYINGELEGSAQIGSQPRYLAEAVGIGNWNPDYDRTRHPFAGKLDEVRIYRRALTLKEIQELSHMKIWLPFLHCSGCIFLP